MQVLKIKKKYNKYDNKNPLWLDIFKEIDMLKINKEPKFIKNIALKYNIPSKILNKKYNRWKIKQNNNNNNSHGGNNKYFNYDEEKNLFDHINNNYIKKCLFLDDECLKIEAINKWNQLYPNKINKFKCSNGWIYKYKKRWKLSTLRTRYTKKAIINENELKLFYDQCKEKAEKIPPKFIFNLDETFWRSVYGNPNVIGITGSENRHVYTNVNPKSGFTAVFLISADGSFHKPTIIMKGKTQVCLNKIADISNNEIHKKFSESGWISVDVLKFILDEINKITQNQECLLILDKYKVHTKAEIKEYANKYNINLIFIPTGSTSTNQPLDVSINGPIKAIGRKLMKKTYMSNQNSKSILKQSLDALIEAKKDIKDETIKKSFTLACKI